MKALLSFVVIFTARFPQSREGPKYPEICRKFTYIHLILMCLCWQIFAQAKKFCEWHLRHLPVFAGLPHLYQEVKTRRGRPH